MAIIGDPDKNELRITLCKMLGLNPDDVRELHISLVAGAIAEVRTTQFLRNEITGEIKDIILKNYRLEPI